MQFSSIWPIDRTLSGATTPGQSEPGSECSEEVLHIPQSSRITEASPSDYLVSYPGHSLSGVLPLFKDVVCVFYSLSQLGPLQVKLEVVGGVEALVRMRISLPQHVYIYIVILKVFKKSLHSISFIKVHLHKMKNECLGLSLEYGDELFYMYIVNAYSCHHLIILSCHQHGYPWPSLATPPYRSLLSVGPQGYTPYPHRAAVSRFELVALPLLSHVSGSKL